MIASIPVTSSAVVTVFTPTPGISAVTIQNNGTGAARLAFGGTTSNSADSPTSSTGYRLLSGELVTLESDNLSKVGVICAIAEGTSTTLDVTTN